MKKELRHTQAKIEGIYHQQTRPLRNIKRVLRDDDRRPVTVPYCNQQQNHTKIKSTGKGINIGNIKDSINVFFLYNFLFCLV